jgi:hypothetical protein
VQFRPQQGRSPVVEELLAPTGGLHLTVDRVPRSCADLGNILDLMG